MITDVPGLERISHLQIVRATLTSTGRFYISRAHTDGTVIQPYRYELGSGWENPRWGAPMEPSSEVTGVINKVGEGSIMGSPSMTMEKANDTTLSLRLPASVNSGTEIMEALVFARLINSPISNEVGTEITFASAVFPSWFLATDQNVSLRLVLPI